MVGYSRLTRLDEEGTVARLRALRRDLFDPVIAEHRGRIVKTTGDGLLVEFASVVDAVRCALRVQQGMAILNTDVRSDRRIEFRVGINLGDVVVDGDDLLGDGSISRRGWNSWRSRAPSASPRTRTATSEPRSKSPFKTPPTAAQEH